MLIQLGRGGDGPAPPRSGQCGSSPWLHNESSLEAHRVRGMVGWAADHFGNKVGEALTEGLSIRVDCHNGKEEAKCVLICRWYGLRDGE